MRLPDDLRKLLERDGWVVTRRADGLEPWAHEIWTLDSPWPPGFTLFLTFLTDPQPGNANPFIEVGTSAAPPATRAAAAGEPLLTVTPRWPEELPSFVARIDALRRRATSGPRA